MVLMPADAAANPAIDIPVEGPVGTPLLPVNNGTAAPAGWNGGTGQYFEIRSRILRVPIRRNADTDAAARTRGFMARTALGFTIAVNQVATSRAMAIGVVLSDSLIAISAAAYAAAFAGLRIADPAYGPSIRIDNDAVIQGQLLMVNFDIYEEKDEDRNPTG